MRDATPTARRAAMVNATLRSLAIGYPTALIIFILALRLIGERWWGTTIALYLPRLPFALPLLPLVVAIVWLGPRRLLWTQVLAVALLLELMGFHPGWPKAAPAGAFHLRVVTCNIDGGRLSLERIMKALRAGDPDVIILQEVDPLGYPKLRKLTPGYFYRDAGQFWLASRFPIVDRLQPPAPSNLQSQDSLRFARYRLETPAGAIDLFNVHPISPRDGLEGVRGDGFRHQILRGDLFNTRARTIVARNTALRLAQLEAIAATARQSPDPVIIAGDTNLPGLSWAFAHWLGNYTDGFSAAGTGFGYSFPAPRTAWMRIDRIIAGPGFSFRDCRVIGSYISDHFAMQADLELTPGKAAASPIPPK